MRKNYIVKLPAHGLALVFIIGMLVTSSCGRNKHNKQVRHDEQVESTLPAVIKAEYGSKVFKEEAQGVINYDTRNEISIASRISGRIERLLIKYNYQPVRKGQLIMEVYAPDLAAAQQELLFLEHSEKDPTLLERAQQRLMLLGMTAQGINQLLKTGKVSYRIPVYSNADGYILEKSAVGAAVSVPSALVVPAAGGDGMSNMGGTSSASGTVPAVAAVSVNSPVMLREGQYVSAGQSLFTIYNADRMVAEFYFKPALASLIKKGDRLTFYKTADKSTVQAATIGMIQPVFKAGGNFTVARVYLNKSGFRVGELLTAKIPVLLTAWWLPASAVVALGNKYVVFKKEGNVLIPKSVKTGVAIAGMVQIKEDISDWQVSKNAAYLVDSDSFIKN